MSKTGAMTRVTEDENIRVWVSSANELFRILFSLEYQQKIYRLVENKICYKIFVLQTHIDGFEVLQIAM